MLGLNSMLISHFILFLYISSINSDMSKVSNPVHPLTEVLQHDGYTVVTTLWFTGGRWQRLLREGHENIWSNGMSKSENIMNSTSWILLSDVDGGGGSLTSVGWTTDALFSRLLRHAMGYRGSYSNPGSSRGGVNQGLLIQWSTKHLTKFRSRTTSV